MKIPIILDGPMGTEIERRGGDTRAPLWSSKALLDDPDLVREIHLDFISAGAEVITTNTFRTQERTFNKVGLKNHGKIMTQLAVELAHEARKKAQKSIKVAGSIAPLEDCYSPELVPDFGHLKREHSDMAKWLNDTGIDIFLIETMNSVKEAKTAVDITNEYDLPIWLGMTVNHEGNLLSGETWTNLLKSVSDIPEIIFVNCSSQIGTTNALQQIIKYRQKHTIKFELGFYPNYLFELEEGRSIVELRNEFHQILDLWMTYQPKVVGTCCGATPEDTKYLANLFNQF
ncbi:MAG: Homocysteine S-methyltransferase [Candidatus Heimdallarchaeota archaeon LC_2]|nr:MAG: Homocysteine S-methyltransferase [Candidatus Heimdallarchaeota archaeon LC_2]